MCKRCFEANMKACTRKCQIINVRGSSGYAHVSHRSIAASLLIAVNRTYNPVGAQRKPEKQMHSKINCIPGNFFFFASQMVESMLFMPESGHF